MNDGPGIRTTVFLKGCPLACAWCHNPESQSASPDLLHFDALCIRCGACAAICPTGCIDVGAQGWRIDRTRCTLCGACVEACPTRALVLEGRTISDDELLERLLVDREFYRESGGGVTFSGGEPLLQAADLSLVLPRLKAEGIHVAVETAGCVEFKAFERILSDVDLLLFDVKAMDPSAHRNATGEGNPRILENLERLAGKGKDIVVRVPVIPGFNDTARILGAIADHVAGLGLPRLDLLPFHPLASGKYAAMGRRDRMAGVPAPGQARMEELLRTLSRPGLSVRIEGAPDPAGGGLGV